MIKEGLIYSGEVTGKKSDGYRPLPLSGLIYFGICHSLLVPGYRPLPLSGGSITGDNACRHCGQVYQTREREGSITNNEHT
jgi:hypothetical protein